MNLSRIAAVMVLVAALGVLGSIPARADLGTIRREAMRGDVQAQLHLGILYEFGVRLADHDVKAVVWYTLAAERGSKEAAHRRDLLSAHLNASEKTKVARAVAALDARMPPASAALANGPPKGGSSDALPAAPRSPQPSQ